MTARRGKAKQERPTHGKSKRAEVTQRLAAELAEFRQRFHQECRDHDLHVLELSARERDLQVIFEAMAAPQNLASDARARWVACRINSLRAMEVDRHVQMLASGECALNDAAKSLDQAVDERLREEFDRSFKLPAQPRPIEKLPSLAEINAKLRAATRERQARDRDSKPIVGA